MPARLEGEFITSSQYKAGDAVPVTFELRNVGDEVVTVLTWFTPLEGLWSDCARVVRNGEEVPYDGFMAKRGNPSEADYVRLVPGESIRSEFDLSRGYDVSREGEYAILPRETIIAVQEPNDSAALLSDTRRRGAAEQNAEVKPRTSTFVVTGEGGRDRTEGVENRAASEKGEEPTAGKAGITKPVSPKLTGGTAAQRPQVTAAHDAGYQLAVTALAGLGNDPTYREWFGVHTSGREATIKGSYTKVKSGMETDQFTYDLTGSGCRSGTYAYTTKGGRTIWLCELFWTAPPTGTDSQAGTVLHEQCHALAYRDDIAYGQTKCRKLAASAPDDAIRNADSHEYHAGG